MKITKEKLEKIIKEEIEKMPPPSEARMVTPAPPPSEARDIADGAVHGVTQVLSPNNRAIAGDRIRAFRLAVGDAVFKLAEEYVMDEEYVSFRSPQNSP